MEFAKYAKFNTMRNNRDEEKKGFDMDESKQRNELIS